jgi:hypothetical protein
MVCALAVGCVGGPGDVPDDQDVTILATPKITSNALTPTQLWNTTLLSGPLNNTNMQSMAATADGRAALHYAIVCALTDHQSVSVVVGGTLYSYQGYLGLASTWLASSLSTAEQQQVSACILSLVNLTGTAINISMRGGPLGYDTGELTNYTIEEGAFWGNLFLGGSSYGSACNGVDQAARDVGNALPYRECAEEDSGNPGTTPCGFIYAGLCTSACGSSNWYGSCSDGVHASTSNVFTSYVIP